MEDKYINKVLASIFNICTKLRLVRTLTKASDNSDEFNKSLLIVISYLSLIPEIPIDYLMIKRLTATLQRN